MERLAINFKTTNASWNEIEWVRALRRLLLKIVACAPCTRRLIFSRRWIHFIIVDKLLVVLLPLHNTGGTQHKLTNFIMCNHNFEANRTKVLWLCKNGPWNLKTVFDGTIIKFYFFFSCHELTTIRYLISVQHSASIERMIFLSVLSFKFYIWYDMSFIGKSFVNYVICTHAFMRYHN